MNRGMILLIWMLVHTTVVAAEPIEIGARRELFVDDALVERLVGKAELRLHAPTPQNVAVVTDLPWEGNGTNYVTVFQDGPLYRMYYRGSHYSYLGGKDRPNTRDLYCYAESTDGILWTKPELGLFAWDGSLRTTSSGMVLGLTRSCRFATPTPGVRPTRSTKRWASATGRTGSMRSNPPMRSTGS